ncbi:hypothetical protein GWI33_019643 [Rhynchophorus ferrugineus]|uniref:Uncharacterized protein n=1 Tax=Rhynchophorus ferrugineus TaxID=354439 RepID=A0A834HR80_RHYFE|nr:hypothetical protein GWI33_019643 [Rhynchophorus ferrugineus]
MPIFCAKKCIHYLNISEPFRVPFRRLWMHTNRFDKQKTFPARSAKVTATDRTPALSRAALRIRLEGLRRRCGSSGHATGANRTLSRSTNRSPKHAYNVKEHNVVYEYEHYG